ncbi:MAG: hypothetical protein WCL18_10010 [bacterium]
MINQAQTQVTTLTNIQTQTQDLQGRITNGLNQQQIPIPQNM